MRSGKEADFESYAKWSKQDLQANVAFMRAFNKELNDSGVFVATEGLAWPNEAKMVRAGSDGLPSNQVQSLSAVRYAFRSRAR